MGNTQQSRSATDRKPPLAHRGVPRAGGARLHGGHDHPAVRDAAVSLFRTVERHAASSASTTSARSSATRAGPRSFWNALGTTPGSSSSTCWCRTRSASPGGAPLRAAPARRRLLPHRDLHPDDPLLRDRRLRLEADPLAALGHRAEHARRIGLKSLFAPWLGQEETALTTLALISVWQFVGIPMMLIYAALLSIPDEVIEAAEWTASPAGRSSGRSSCR